MRKLENSPVMMESSVSAEEVAVADFHCATSAGVEVEMKKKKMSAAWRWRRAAINID